LVVSISTWGAVGSGSPLTCLRLSTATKNLFNFDWQICTPTKLKLYKEVIVNRYNEKTKAQKGDQADKATVTEKNKRLSKARELLLCGDIEAEDYRVMKSEIEM